MIPERDYKVSGYVSADTYDTAIRACDSLAHNYDGAEEINALIDDVVDRVVPIFRTELAEVVWELESYIGQALDEGLVETDPEKFSLLNLIQIGYCEFLTETLSENLDTIVFNNLVQTVNENPSNEPYEEEIEEAIDVISLNASHDSTFANYERRLMRAIFRIKATSDRVERG